MGKYLKMADVFDLPVSADLYRVDFAVISDDKDSIVGGFGVDGMSGAAAHAINSHDELVAEVERLNKECDQLTSQLLEADAMVNEMQEIIDNQ